MIRTGLVLVSLVAIAAPAARAQDAQKAPPEQIVPNHAPSGLASPPPSEKLSESGGVIHPPLTDPGIRAAPPVPAPHTGMVVAPPGTPGGDPSVVPK